MLVGLSDKLQWVFVVVVHYLNIQGLILVAVLKFRIENPKKDDNVANAVNSQHA